MLFSNLTASVQSLHISGSDSGMILNLGVGMSPSLEVSGVEFNYCFNRILKKIRDSKGIWWDLATPSIPRGTATTLYVFS